MISETTNKYLGFAASVIFILLISAFGRDENADLQNKRWQFVSFADTMYKNKLTYPAELIFKKGDNIFSGKLFCNTASGKYIMNATLHSLKFEGIYTSWHACKELKQETHLVDLLKHTTNYKLVNDNLILYNGSKKIMTFIAR